MSTRAAFDVVLPCFNPASGWQHALMQFHQSVADHYQLNYILVNDGTPEAALLSAIDEIRSHGIPLEYIAYETNRGKGFALRHGVVCASSDFVLYTDIDFPFTTESMVDVMAALSSGSADVVVGERSADYYGHKMSSARRLMSKYFRWLIRRLNLKVTDTQCGLKAFNGAGKKKFLETTINRYLFDFQFIWLVASDARLRITGVPVRLKAGVEFRRMPMWVVAQEAWNLVRILKSRRRSKSG